MFVFYRETDSSIKVFIMLSTLKIDFSWRNGVEALKEMRRGE